MSTTPRIALLAAVVATADSPPEPEAPAARPELRITDASLFRHLEVLASDDFLGRRAGEEGAELAAAYLIQQFRQMEFGPKGTRRYSQPFEKGKRKLFNVIARLEGTDPKLRDEHLVIGAHFDHLGQRGESIFNGSDDNASGCAGLLEVARALADDNDLRRSVLFIGFDGEEIGLLGSRHFVRKPTVDKDSIVAMINMDMISRGATDDVRVCGTKYSPLLKEIVEAQAPKVDLELHYDFERKWRRASDHGPFGDAGIPFLYFGVLDHDDYHKASDTTEKANQAKMTRIARLVYLTARAIANHDERATYDE